MFKFLEKISELGLKGLFAVVGLVLLLISLIHLKDFKTLTFEVYPQPKWLVFAIAILLLGIALLIQFEVSFNHVGFLKSNQKLTKRGNIFTFNFNRTVIKIHLGKLEDIVPVNENAITILPANDVFDDKCITDRRSVLGAFVYKNYCNLEHQILNDIIDNLNSKEHCAKIKVNSEGDIFKDSYGIGAYAYFKDYKGKGFNVAFTAVTEKRSGDGVYSDLTFIFIAINEIYRCLSDNQYTTLYTPLLCAGHGGMDRKVAFFSLLLALSQTSKRPGGHHLSEVNIVIFRKDDNSEPDVDTKTIRRVINAVASIN